MALVSGVRSTLNPDAPLFIPAAFRQVEDFSPEWWQLITTSTWYKDYWLSQHQDENGFYDDGAHYDGGDVADLLPDTFDLDAGEDFSAQFDEFVSSFESDVGKCSYPFPVTAGFEKDSEAAMRDLSLLMSPRSTAEPAKYADKAAKYANPKSSPRRIQQPR